MANLHGGPALEDLSLLPKKARRTDKLKLKDFTSIDGKACVSQKFKDAVESLEPGAHQFSSIELQEKDGTPIPEQYYLFNNCQAAPCVLAAHSEMKPVSYTYHENMPFYFCHSTNVGLSRQVVEGWHLCGGSIILPSGCVFMSDELFKRFKQDRLKPFRYHEATFFDEPWMAEENVPELVQWMKDNPELAEDKKRFFVKKSIKQN
ncbi:hypothetical protein ROA7450_03932 [Roseovarius albus]|uniref:Immunity MXAN-0049 protein domain-containing protein n=2 Tax=Roseovarius albus TaxID=1247867 RepID=A0A1X7A6P6_9RHOB|nr:hypothetical protein ROA7450_03932 [Roseovarius albus]